MKKKLGLIIILLALIAGGIWFYKDLKTKEIYNSLNVELKEDVTLEYGQEANPKDYVEMYTDESELVWGEFDTSSIGEKEVQYTISKDDLSKEFVLKYKVVDTNKPEIKLKKETVTIKQDDKIDILDYIVSVSDAVDGKLDYKEKVSGNDVHCYTLTTDLNQSKPGTYKVTIKAIDKNGNQNEKTMTIKVEEKKVETEVSHNTTNSYNPDFKINKKKVIVINAGHQAKGNSAKEAVGPNSSTTKAKVTTGATGKYSKVKESQINLDVALKLRDELKSRGYTVYMIRTTQNVNISNQQRALIANGYEPAAVISLHCDSADSSSAQGAHTIAIKSDNPYCSPLYSASSSLAKSVINAYCKETGIKSRGISYRNDLTGLNWSTVPAIYLEMGFLSNEQEDLSLADSDFQYKCAKGIANGIDQYLK